MRKKLDALPLTAERFAPFGEVIEAAPNRKQAMNSARFERFVDLAQVDIGADDGGRPSVSIARCRTATTFPHQIDMLERHPHGSQVFMPLSGFSFVVAVAPAAESVEVDDIVAFVSNGRQGINYRKGVWHMPMIAGKPGQEFLILDRAGEGENCDEHYLEQPILLSAG